jgi:tRNA threonylcarbamoyladenosine biosynthesis protein TsaE
VRAPADAARVAVPKSPRLTVRLADRAATERLGGRLADLARPGDVIALAGELGAGKTTLARGVIHALARRFGRTEEEVPSPTFTLVQSYDFPVATVHHFDLYRIARPEEAVELGIDEAFAAGISLIEWPERLGPLLPADRLDIELRADGARRSRLAAIRGRGSWEARAKGLADD